MYQVTQNDIAQYWDRGYWISPKLIDDDRIAKLRAAMDRLFKGERDGEGWYFEDKLNVQSDPNALKRVINAWWVNEDLREMVLDPGLGKIAADLMKVPAARLWADQALVKPPAKDGKSNAGNIGWHQDGAYWHILSTHNMVTAWIALQDTDLNNGGMRTLAKSHSWGLIPESDKFFEKNLDNQREFFLSRVKGEWIDEPCILKAGCASFHHSLCFHGSETNRTNDPRMSVVGHYMPDGTAFKPSGKFQVFLRLLGPNPKAGQPLNGRAFPMVYPKREEGVT
jgi:ectoine hydroxylase-related dioxygenase (phytanoyl-CoA dioxygenase family)